MNLGVKAIRLLAAAILAMEISASALSAQADGVQAWGHVHGTLGAATLEVGSDAAGRRRLEIRNLGSSGQDGVTISRALVSQPGDVTGDGMEAAFDASGAGPGSSLAARARVSAGDVTGDAVELRCVHTGAAAEISSVILDPARYAMTRTVQLYRDGVPFLSREVSSDDPFARVVPEPGAAAIAFPFDLHITISYDPFRIEVRWTYNGQLVGSASTAPRVPVDWGGQVVECDAIGVVVSPLSAAPHMLSAVELRGSGLEALSIADEISSFRYHGWRWESSSSPSRLRYHRWMWRSVGDASLGMSRDARGRRQLTLENLGSSGQDGVILPDAYFRPDLDGDGAADAVRPGGFEMAFAADGAATGSSLETRLRVAQGDVEADGLAVRCVLGAEALELSSATLLPGLLAAARTVTLQHGGVTVASGDLDGDGVFARVIAAEGATARPLPWDFHWVLRDGELCLVITFRGLLSARTAGSGGGGSVLVETAGSLVECDSVQLSLRLEHGDTQHPYRGASLLASGIDRLRIFDASSSFAVDGIDHHTLGEAACSISNLPAPKGMRVANIGSSGEDGVAVQLGRRGSQEGDVSGDGFAMAFDPEGLREGSSIEAAVVVSQPGDFDGDGSVRLEQHGTAFELSVFGFEPTPIAAAAARVTAIRGGVRVRSVDVNADGLLGRVVSEIDGRPMPGPQDLHIWWDFFTGLWCVRFTWDRHIDGTYRAAPPSPGIALEVGDQVTPCDAIELEVLCPRVPMREPLCYFALRCANLDALTILDESTTSRLNDLAHHTLGQARATVSNADGTRGQLTIANIGSSGQDGVAVNAADLDRDGRPDLLAGYEVAFESSGVRDGSRMALRARGTIPGDPDGSIVAAAAAVGGKVELSLAMEGAGVATSQRKRVNAYRGDVVVATAEVDGDGVARVISSTANPTAIAWFKDMHIIFYPFFKITFTYDGVIRDDPLGVGAAEAPLVTVELGGQIVDCDSIGVSFEDGTPLAPAMAGIELTGADLDAFTITDENVLPAAPEAPQLLRGDSNGDGGVDIGDAVWTLSYLFSGGRAPPCSDAADANDTGEVDLSDPIFELNFLFLGGREPPSPGTTLCGADPTPDALDCATPSARCGS